MKGSSGSAGSDCAWVDYVQWTPSGGGGTPPVNVLDEAVDFQAVFATGGDADWDGQSSEYYYDSDAAESGDISDSEESWMSLEVVDTGTLSFYWKVSSESGYDWLEFYLDDVRQDRISGTVDWQQKSYNIADTGTHTFKWRYMKDGSVSDGDDCGWVDYVQWSGSLPGEPEPEPTDWDQIEYIYDPAGRRIERKVDGVTQLKFLYDGDHIIAEYDASDTLLRKYVHGPGIDEPICLIESSGSYAGTQYYHYDALGSVVALSDGDGDVVQLYEYSVYGQVAASDANHPNRFMFTGREFDKDTGLYYYRARYYNPEIGRFLQSDPARDGMNWYAYCGNNAIGRTDPSGCSTWHSGICVTPDINFSMPAEIIFHNGVTGLSQVEIRQQVVYWLSFTGALKGYWDEWDVWSATLTSDNATLDIVLTHIGYNCNPKTPVLSVTYHEIIADTTPKILGGLPTDPTVVDTVPLLRVNGVAILDNGTIDRIIKPAIEEINEWVVPNSFRAILLGGVIGSGLAAIRMPEHLLTDWDSWFYDQSGEFMFNGSIYRGPEINYIVGGHAFRHYGFQTAQMKWCAFSWKKYMYGHSPDDPALAGTLFWLYKGYNTWYLRKYW